MRLRKPAVLLLLLPTLVWPAATSPTPTASAAAAWQDTGVALPGDEACVDGSQPNTLLSDDIAGTVAYNWASKSHTVLNSHSITLCAPNGLFFSVTIDPKPQDKPAWRFSMADPLGRGIDHMPTSVPDDGTLQAYALETKTNAGHLWASADGGLTWQERGSQFAGKIRSLSASDVDGHAIYALVEDQSPTPTLTKAYSIYFSADAGVTWEKRSSRSLSLQGGSGAGADLSFLPIRGRANPINDVVLYSAVGSGNLYQEDYYLSNDGARNFSPVGSLDPAHSNSFIEIYHTPEGLLRRYGLCDQGSCSLTLSTDEGKTWQPLPLPAIKSWDRFALSHEAPSDILIGGTDNQNNHKLYYSHDGGHTWQQFDYIGFQYAGPLFTPYLPMSVLGKKDGHLYVLDLPAAGSQVKSPVKPLGSPVAYFPETQHNLSGVFKAYWDSHGGLAQQGYPLTEVFREVSDLNHKVYAVQYFERAVFEYHPENAPPNDVLLTLLGIYEYKNRYGDAGAPNQHVNPDNSLSFSQTGHAIGGAFRQYWETHGGLAQQGYPISDEFQEVSSLNGKTFTVQYFERAIFEFHPENAGTPFQVLLSQLGKFRLDAKYGAPVPQP